MVRSRHLGSHCVHFQWRSFGFPVASSCFSVVRSLVSEWFSDCSLIVSRYFPNPYRWRGQRSTNRCSMASEQLSIGFPMGFRRWSCMGSPFRPFVFAVLWTRVCFHPGQHSCYLSRVCCFPVGVQCFGNGIIAFFIVKLFLRLQRSVRNY